ncbi:QueT transporter family protein [Clostridium sp. CS001]|uniref:QueT transporter family protein n=1 Tax=Clostridium sp. CS001 TaxID=2880648 RepID=UPI001CF24790|nr:QueT transporter family protein [Clostridium sp. CS001]MCB2289581.1 QueT transporter family protein [Clostridium sp. CS001]
MNIKLNEGNMSVKIRRIVFAAMVAAIYAALTLSLSFFSFGVVQYRIAEGLTILPYFASFSIPGLVIGCIVSNIISPLGIMDMVFGSIATLIAAISTYYIGKSKLHFKRVLAPLPAVIINAIIIGILLRVLYFKTMPLSLCMLQVAWGEFVCCYGIGLPLIYVIEKNPILRNFFK